MHIKINIPVISTSKENLCQIKIILFEIQLKLNFIIIITKFCVTKTFLWILLQQIRLSPIIVELNGAHLSVLTTYGSKPYIYREKQKVYPQQMCICISVRQEMSTRCTFAHPALLCDRCRRPPQRIYRVENLRCAYAGRATRDTRSSVCEYIYGQAFIRAVDAAERPCASCGERVRHRLDLLFGTMRCGTYIHTSI